MRDLKVKSETFFLCWSFFAKIFSIVDGHFIGECEKWLLQNVAVVTKEDKWKVWLLSKTMNMSPWKSYFVKTYLLFSQRIKSPNFAQIVRLFGDIIHKSNDEGFFKFLFKIESNGSITIISGFKWPVLDELTVTTMFK